MDNVGNYVEYEELIAELFEDGSSVVNTVGETVLSGKTVDPAGDIYDFVGGAPKINDVVYQSGEFAYVKSLPTLSKVQISKTGSENKIVNGPAQFLRSSKLTKRRADSLIKMKMAFIDKATRQFFNKRTGTFKIEGNNTPLMQFPVPIIEIMSLIINSTDLELFEGEDKDFVSFKGRSWPTDDRGNPRLKLNVGRGRDSIFTAPSSNRVFTRGTLTTIEGSFGYLEEDGSTPEPIKEATKILIFEKLNDPSSSTGDTGADGAGPLRRIKVDLHEKEFFAPTSSSASESQGSLSGIHEVDVILAQYRSPLAISGSFPIFRGSDWKDT